jgi:hypothetical protein
MSDELPPDVIPRLYLEADLSIPPDKSALAPLGPERLALRLKAACEIAEMKEKGLVLDLPGYDGLEGFNREQLGDRRQVKKRHPG